MNRFRISLVVLAAVAPLLLIPVSRVAAVGPKVSEYRAAPNHNKHNLSAKAWGASGLTANENPYRAKDISEGGIPAGQQICIFCHTPHSASSENPSPLWNRKSSTQNFSRYSSATLQIRSISDAKYGPNAQPDGASKLCLSCHDGVSKLNIVLQGAPDTGIPMVGSDVIIPTSPATFDPTSNPNKMKFGHHPVSFVYTGGIGGVQSQISSGRVTAGLGGGFGFAVPASGSVVKLDKYNKMQCTTCHNAHQNQSDDTMCYDAAGTTIDTCDTTTYTRKVVPFWVYGVSGNATNDHDAVCTSCHRMTGYGGIPLSPPPTPFP